ncbi:MAG TPA: carbonic anhydrase [Candidatus Acidoferrum sp.]|jgi:carbonic anhydrase|nr:carbonic anhydrase [Candidatus Acidoferrum sp.]
MRLIEAVIDANHRALAGDPNAGLHPTEFEAELPLVALTCIDVRLNAILPQVLGIPPEDFIWLRNAGNVITGPLSSTMRSLALACAVKGGKEIAIIGHTDCLVGKTTTMDLIERLRAMGVERHLLPDNINEYFGIFSSERQNVIKSAGIVRSSPLIGTKIPVHGLLVDTQTGKVDWLVNGYETLETLGTRWNEVVKSAGQTVDAMKPLTDFKIGEMKFPETKIGEIVTQTEDWLKTKVQQMETKPPAAPTWAAAPAAPRIPLPPPIRPRIVTRRGPQPG